MSTQQPERTQQQPTALTGSAATRSPEEVVACGVTYRKVKPRILTDVEIELRRQQFERIYADLQRSSARSYPR